MRKQVIEKWSNNLQCRMIKVERELKETENGKRGESLDKP